MNKQKQDLKVKQRDSGNPIHFREINRRYTWPIELLNNLAPKHRIYGLVEIDVTSARQFISENEAKTGEKLSFTAWVIRCIAQAIGENKEVQGIKKGRTKLIVFEDVDIGVIIERQVKSKKIATQHIIRKANEKSFRQIHDEIRRVQRSDSSDHVVTRERIQWMVRFFLKLPSYLRKPFWWKVKSDPFLRKHLMGTVGVTSLGMFGKGGGWAIPIGVHQIVFGLGGISKKAKNMINPLDIGEYLSMTVMLDEEITLGAPAARFIARLSELMETGFGLE